MFSELVYIFFLAAKKIIFVYPKAFQSINNTNTKYITCMEKYVCVLCDVLVYGFHFRKKKRGKGKSPGERV